MNTLPAAFEEQMKKQLGDEAADFFRSLQQPSPVSIRLNPGKTVSFENLGIAAGVKSAVPWCPEGCYLAERPVFTLDPCLHGGAYYVQEASSMFLCHVLRQVMPSTPVRMLDLCAAPGGKSTLAAAMLPEGSLLIANEVIRSRASILRENVIKWGQDNIVVTNNDPADFQSFEGAFDILLVDAPCSGEGMFRKDPGAIEEWKESNVRLCSERQKRILSDIWDCLRPGGILIYSTCTYNPTENEHILEWLTNKYEAESIEIQHTFTNITPACSSASGYHFYPHKTEGEGFFIGVLRKNGGKDFSLRKSKKAKNTPSPVLPPEIRARIREPERYSPCLNDNILSLVPTGQANFISLLERELRVIYKGCEVAEVNNRKYKLLHPFALWQGLNKEMCTIYQVGRDTALTFLKKEDIPAPDGLAGDWILVTYRDIPLGWCKNLGNRLNNYYPKEWRIRMQLNDSTDK